MTTAATTRMMIVDIFACWSSTCSTCHPTATRGKAWDRVVSGPHNPGGAWANASDQVPASLRFCPCIPPCPSARSGRQRLQVCPSNFTTPRNASTIPALEGLRGCSFLDLALLIIEPALPPSPPIATPRLAFSRPSYTLPETLPSQFLWVTFSSRVFTSP